MDFNVPAIVFKFQKGFNIDKIFKSNITHLKTLLKYEVFKLEISIKNM